MIKIKVLNFNELIGVVEINKIIFLLEVLTLIMKAILRNLKRIVRIFGVNFHGIQPIISENERF